MNDYTIIYEMLKNKLDKIINILEKGGDALCGDSVSSTTTSDPGRECERCDGDGITWDQTDGNRQCPDCHGTGKDDICTCGLKDIDPNCPDHGTGTSRPDDPPERIYLQWSESIDDDNRTWCQDRINNSDVEYTRNHPDPDLEGKVVNTLIAEEKRLQAEGPPPEPLSANIYMSTDQIINTLRPLFPALQQPKRTAHDIEEYYKDEQPPTTDADGDVEEKLRKELVEFWGDEMTLSDAEGFADDAMDIVRHYLQPRVWKDPERRWPGEEEFADALEQYAKTADPKENMMDGGWWAYHWLGDYMTRKEKVEGRG